MSDLGSNHQVGVHVAAEVVVMGHVDDDVLAVAVDEVLSPRELHPLAGIPGRVRTHLGRDDGGADHRYAGQLVGPESDRSVVTQMPNCFVINDTTNYCL